VARRLKRDVPRFVAAALIVVAITYLYYRLIHVNPTTVGFSFLVAVLVVSTVWGLSNAVFAAVLATLAYNFFFLPPIGRFTIADPQNWVALAAFLITAMIASQLSERVRREARNANRRRQDVERLYSFSQELLATDNVLELLNAIPARVAEIFGATAAAIYLSERRATYYSDLAAQALIPEDALQASAAWGETRVDSEHGISFAALRVGVRSVGEIGVVGASLSRETLDALGSLIAIAIERAGAVEKLSRAEAARQSEVLRTALLDSVTHEFRTPLTSILASAQALMSDSALDEAARTELLSVINEEGERLNRLIGEAAEMAQLDAHEVELHIQPFDLREAIEGAMEESGRALKGHTVEVSIPDNLPKVKMDLKRIQEVFAHLLDNAAKYSPPESAIHISAEAKGGTVMASVADHGPGIDEFEQALIFGQFYRGKGQRAVHGTGMGLAIVKAIVEAHSGTVGLTSQLGHGSVFQFSLPAVQTVDSAAARRNPAY
jgi:two-component system sensor histidine kinase KdpD